MESLGELLEVLHMKISVKYPYALYDPTTARLRHRFLPMPIENIIECARMSDITSYKTLLMG